MYAYTLFYELQNFSKCALNVSHIENINSEQFNFCLLVSRMETQNVNERQMYEKKKIFYLFVTLSDRWDYDVFWWNLMFVYICHLYNFHV